MNVDKRTVLKGIRALESNGSLALRAETNRTNGKDAGARKSRFFAVVDKGQRRTENLDIRADAARAVILGLVLLGAADELVVDGADKSSRLGSVAGQRTLAGDEPAQEGWDGLDSVGEVVEGRARLGLADDAAGAQMVLEVLTDGAVVLDDGDAQLLEVLGGTNAAQHERLGRVDGAAR